jgi:hypothetical protein
VADDVGERGLIAWSGQDEPDLHRTPIARIDEMRDALRAADPERPFFLNFWGGAVLSRTDGYCNGPGDGTDEDCYPRYIRRADWVGGDIYPVNRVGGDLSVVGRMIDRLEGWSGRRPVFAYIESSDWDGDGVGPSGRQLRAQIWHAIVHGARGIFYFAVRLTATGCCADYDATPADVAETMTRQHARIEAIAPALQSPIDPAGFRAQVAAPLEATWRLHGEEATYVVLNFSNDVRADRAITLHGLAPGAVVSVLGEDREVVPDADGAFRDDFGPYEVHVYRAPAEAR